MATIAAALTAIANLMGGVTGITVSYDVGGVPDSIERGALPAALVIPENGEELGFQTLAYLGNAPVIKFSAKQIILVAPEDSNKFKDVVPTLITLLDAIMQALKAQPFLTAPSAPAVFQPVQVKPSVGIVSWGGISYHGIVLNYMNLEIYI